MPTWRFSPTWWVTICPRSWARLPIRPQTALVKGGIEMVRVLTQAVRDRQRALREDLVIDYGVRRLRVGVEASAAMVNDVRRRFRYHNAGRAAVETAMYERLARSSREELEPATLERQLGRTPQMRAALDWMWPVLSPQELLRDLFGSRALVRSAARGVLSAAEADSLVRDRAASPEEVRWTEAEHAPAGRGLPAVGTTARAEVRRSRDQDLRPHRRRRGPGSDAHGAADDRPAIPERVP